MERWDKVFEVDYTRTSGGRALTMLADQRGKRQWSDALKAYTYDGWEPSACQCQAWLRCRCKPGSDGFNEREAVRNR